MPGKRLLVTGAAPQQHVWLVAQKVAELDRPIVGLSLMLRGLKTQLNQLRCPSIRKQGFSQ
jgi:hypothetical protein